MEPLEWIPHFEFARDRVAYNYRMPDINAALGLANWSKSKRTLRRLPRKLPMFRNLPRMPAGLRSHRSRRPFAFQAA